MLRFMDLWRREARGFTGRTVATVAWLVLASAGTVGAQVQVADSLAKTPDFARQDSIQAERARPRRTSCDIRGHFPQHSAAVNAWAACEISRVPAPSLVEGLGLYPIGEWKWIVNRRPNVDRLDAIFILPATNSVAPNTGTLVLECENGKLEAYVNPGQPLDHGYNDSVTVWFDMDPPQEDRWLPGPPKGEQWFAGADSTTLFVSGDQKVVRAFVRKLGDYERFVIQVRPRQGPPRTLAFDQGRIGLVSAQIMAAGCR
jgi:hypothetical protein